MEQKQVSQQKNLIPDEGSLEALPAQTARSSAPSPKKPTNNVPDPGAAVFQGETPVQAQLRRLKQQSASSERPLPKIVVTPPRPPPVSIIAKHHGFGWKATASFYEQLGAMLRSGLEPHHASSMALSHSGGGYARSSKRLLDHVSNGGSLAEGLAMIGERSLIVSLVHAGERSGRLPEICREISTLFETASRLRLQVIGRLLYPLVLLHAAMVLPCVVGAVAGSMTPWMILAGPIALWIFILIAWISFSILNRHGALSRFALLPPAGFVVWPFVVQRTALVLQAGLEAGLLTSDALRMTASGCGNRVVAASLLRSADIVEKTRDLRVHEALHTAGLPDMYVRLISTGEEGGSLEQSLAKVAKVSGEIFSMRLDMTAKFLNGLFYTIAAAAAIIAIISMYMGYLNQAKALIQE
jgi:general secretion pathway protein F